MKKYFTPVVMVFMALFVLSATGIAEFIGSSVSKRELSVAEIKKSGSDDQEVILRGNIAQHFSKKKYVFKDPTGEIIVKIDHKYMPIESITPETPLLLEGELDIDGIGNFKEIKVDVKKVTVLPMAAAPAAK